MGSRFDKLLKRLRKATLQRGKKAALAAFIGVPAPRLSEWFSGVHIPTAEVTLQMLEWVSAEEAQQKRAGGAINTTDAKTRQKALSHAKPTGPKFKPPQ